MVDGPNDVDDEFDEPTQPYRRREIERLIERNRLTSLAAEGESTVLVVGIAAPPAQMGSDDEEGWTEIAGRWVKVSLDALAHIGHSGTPRGMITCRLSPIIVGEIGWGACAASSTTGSIADDSSEFESYRPRPGRWLVGAVLLVAVAFAVRTSWWSNFEPADAKQVPAVVTAPTVAAAEDPPQTPLAPPPPEPPAQPALTPGPQIERRSEDTTAACAAHRRNAEVALHEGDWSTLEALAKRTKCWSKPSKAKALRLQALFELERLEECVDLSENERAKEIIKWHQNCSLALQ